MKRSFRFVIVAASVIALVSCGGDNGAKDPRPLSQLQAERMAQAGYLNLRFGGARFEANSAFLGPGESETLVLVGEIDWKNHVGRAVVRGDGMDASLAEVVWGETFVLERRPAMDALIAGRGGPSQPWISRRPEPSTRQLDRLLAIVLGLAMEQPDNAILIQQSDGSAFVRADEIRGTAVEVLRYGTRNLYWLDSSDGRMLRFEGNSAAGNAPTIVDFLSHEEVTIPRPADADVVTVDSIAEIYNAYLGA